MSGVFSVTVFIETEIHFLGKTGWPNPLVSAPPALGCALPHPASVWVPGILIQVLMFVQYDIFSASFILSERGESGGGGACL